MLRLTDHIEFEATATIRLKGLKSSFKVLCRLLPTDELQALQDKQAKGELTPAQFVQTFVVGWPKGQVRDAADNEVPFSDAALGKLLTVPGAPVALVRAFYAGYEEATEGNSEPLSAS